MGHESGIFGLLIAFTCTHHALVSCLHLCLRLQVTEGIPDPYVDQSPRIEVPEAIYTQDPPYDPTVVGLGDKVSAASRVQCVHVWHVCACVS